MYSLLIINYIQVSQERPFGSKKKTTTHKSFKGDLKIKAKVIPTGF